MKNNIKFNNRIKHVLNRLLYVFKNIDVEIYYILLVTLVLCFPLMSKKYFYGHDTLYHISNIEAIGVLIKKFKISKIVPIIAKGFGYGGGIFYPKLPHYFAATMYILFSKFGATAVTGIKLSNIITIFLSGIFMYKLLTCLFSNKKGALFGSVLYMTMPYFISEIYVRSAYNESFIFIFMPMIFIGLLSLFNGSKKDFYIYFVLGYIGILSSHLVMSIYFTLIVLLFLLLNIKKVFQKKKILDLINASIIILIIISPDIILMIQHKNMQLYRVFDYSVMGSTFECVKGRSISFNNYFFPKIVDESGIYWFLNIITIIFTTIGIFSVIKNFKKEKNINLLVAFVILLIFSTFMCTRYFPYEYLPKILLSIQFAFRNITLVNFCITILATYGFLQIKSQKMLIKFIIITDCIIIAFFINNVNLVDSKTIKIDENAGMGYQKEYLNIYTSYNIDYYNQRNNDIIVLSGDKNAKINNIVNKTPYLEFNIYVSENTELEIPRLFYLGYDIVGINKNGKIVHFNYSLSENGFIKFSVDKPYVIKINYIGTKLYRICYFARLLFVFLLTIYLLFLKNKIRSKVHKNRNIIV